MTSPHTVTALAATRGWMKLFGLHGCAAALTVIVDLMANGATIATMGMFVPFEILAGVVLTFLVYRIQRHWYGDDGPSAAIKGMIVGFLTAIPVATTPYILAYAIGGGLLGTFAGKKPAETVDPDQDRA